MLEKSSKLKSQISKSQLKTKSLKKPVKGLKVDKSKQLKANVSLSAKAKTEKKSNLTVDVYDIKGKVVGEMELPKEVFGEKVNKTLLAQAVRVYLVNQRRGTASTKTRGEVRGSTRKIWKQKGTGRARHGGIRAPIFVGGGIALGPRPRDYSLHFPKKMRRKALFSALSAKAADKQIKVIDSFEDMKPKTKVMIEIFKALNTDKKKRNLMLVLPSFEGENESAYRAVRNIAGVKATRANLLNAYEVLKSKVVLFPKASIEEVKKTFTQG